MKILMAPLMVAGLLAAAPAANAATFILTPAAAADGSFTLAFNHTGVVPGEFARADEFEDIFEFLLPIEGKLSGSIVTIANTPNDPHDPSNIDFKFVTLNLASFTLTSPPAQFEAGSVAAMTATPGTQRLVVHGFTGSNASYAGTLNFKPDAVTSVPEPASWALMIAGFGGAGAALRSRRRRTLAQA